MTRKTDVTDRTDGFFGFVMGLYATVLAAPGVTIGVALRVTADPGALYLTLLGTVVVGTAPVAWVARRESVAVRLGATRWVWAAMVLPFGYFGVLVAGTVGRPGDLPEAVGAIAIAGAVAGLVVGAGLVTAAHNRHVKAVLADAEKRARFTAPAPERDRRMAKRAMAGLVTAGVLGILGSVALDFAPLRWSFQLVVPIAAGLYGTTNSREVGVSDAGIVVGTPVYRRLRPWSAFESYSVTEEAIIVRRVRWSPWGLRDLRRDVSEVEDPEEIAAALGEFLPRE